MKNDWTFINQCLRAGNRQRLNKSELVCLVNILERVIREDTNEKTSMQKKLNIATSALRFYSDTTTWECCYKCQCAYVDGMVAQQALKEIDLVGTSMSLAKEEV
jgi:hypothetical protein